MMSNPMFAVTAATHKCASLFKKKRIMQNEDSYVRVLKIEMIFFLSSAFNNAIIFQSQSLEKTLAISFWVLEDGT